MQKELEKYFVTVDVSVHDIMMCINKNLKGIALVVDHNYKLVGTITDGDIRRAILSGKSLDSPCNELLVMRETEIYPEPITSSIHTSPNEIANLLKKHKLRHIPLVDDHGVVVDLVGMEDLFEPDGLPLQAVIMAGGFGKRLLPLTKHLPKPMLPVGDRPLLEHTIGSLKDAGIRQVHITTHYLSEHIEQHFGDGKDFGVNLHYVSEGAPMGTAGALSLMKKPSDPVLVINGDVLTKVDFRAMLDFPRETHADLTVGVRQYDIEVPYGVVKTNGVNVRMIEEKPNSSFLVTAGIYLIDPESFSFIPEETCFDMPELIQRLIDERRTVVSFPIIEYWCDIGKPEDYRQVQNDIENGKVTK